MTDIEIIGLRELQAAVARNPGRVQKEGRNFLQRGLAKYKQGIIRNPWRLGQNGGGSPVKTGNLRDTHETQISGLEGRIGPNTALARYARYVHQGTRRMHPRPWLEYVKQSKDAEIRVLYGELLQNIVKDLAN